MITMLALPVLRCSSIAWKPGRSKFPPEKPSSTNSSTRMMPCFSQYSRTIVRCVSILDGKRQQCSLLLSLFAHESVVGAYVIQQMADRLFSVGNRCSALLAFTQMLQVFLMGNSCVYAIDMVKLRCGWFNPSDIYKIGGSVMFRFMQKQSGLSHFGFWPSPHLWTGQLKIYHVGA